MKLKLLTASAVTGSVFVIYLWYKKRRQNYLSSTKYSALANPKEDTSNVVENSVIPNDNIGTKTSDNIEIVNSSTVITSIKNSVPAKPVNMQTIVEEQHIITLEPSLDDLKNGLCKIQAIDEDLGYVMSRQSESEKEDTPPKECSSSESSEITECSEIAESSHEEDSAVDVRCSSGGSKDLSVKRKKKRNRKNRKVVNLWHSDDAGDMQVDPNTQETQKFFYLPTDLVGGIIGKRGCFIGNLKHNHGVVAVIHPTDDPNTEILSLKGRPGNIVIAICVINAKLNRMRNNVTLIQIQEGNTRTIPDMRRSLEMDFYRSIYVTSTLTPTQVWVNVLDDPIYAQYYAMQAQLNDNCNTSAPPIVTSPQLNSMYIVQPYAGKWWRGQLLEYTAHTYRVALIDCGEIVTVSTLHYLDPELLAVPMQATLVNIGDLTPVVGDPQKTEEAWRLLSEFISYGAELYAKAISHGEHIVAIDLLREESDKKYTSLGYLLETRGLAIATS